MKYIAKRVYNNNVVLSENKRGEEVIFVGKGLAYGLSKGDTIDLEKAGYKVDENPVIVNLDTTKLEGYKSSLYGYKTVDGTEDAILILIFDSTANVEKATASKETSSGDKMANDFVTIMYRWGRNHAPETDTSVYGTANNIVWAGSSEAKKAAGIL